MTAATREELPRRTALPERDSEAEEEAAPAPPEEDPPAGLVSTSVDARIDMTRLREAWTISFLVSTTRSAADVCMLPCCCCCFSRSSASVSAGGVRSPTCSGSGYHLKAR